MKFKTKEEERKVSKVGGVRAMEALVRRTKKKKKTLAKEIKEITKSTVFKKLKCKSDASHFILVIYLFAKMTRANRLDETKSE